MKTSKIKLLIRNLFIEILIYGILLVVYFFLVLRYLGNFLTDLFENQLFLYSILGLGLIVAQAVLLETITSYLIRLFRLDRMV